MPDAVVQYLQRDHRRLYAYLHALLPGQDVRAAFRDFSEHVQQFRDRVGEGGWAALLESGVHGYAADRRKSLTPLPFSDDLFRQLADSAGPILDVADKWATTLDTILRQLPPPERDLLRRRYERGLTTGQIAQADDRPVAVVARDLAALHESLVTALREAVADAGPQPPGGAADLGRLSDQLLDGCITEDGRLVLETLLLADAAAQCHYHRHAALAADLDWHYRGPPPLPEPAPADTPRRVTAREWALTGAFVAAVLAVIAFVVLRLTGYP